MEKSNSSKTSTSLCCPKTSELTCLDIATTFSCYTSLPSAGRNYDRGSLLSFMGTCSFPQFPYNSIEASGAFCMQYSAVQHGVIPFCHSSHQVMADHSYFSRWNGNCKTVWNLSAVRSIPEHQCVSLGSSETIFHSAMTQKPV